MDASDIQKVTLAVTKKWAKQRKSEERQSRARSRRSECWSSRINQSDVAWRVIPEAYAKVSDQGRLPANARQLYYAARPEIEKQTDRQLDYGYFSQNLLRRYLNYHASETADWLIAYDDRGRLIEPHTEKSVPLGTLKVADYLKSVRDHTVGTDLGEIEIDLPRKFPTCGPKNRFSALLYIEKEGFNPLLEAAKLAERYDIAIMSCKGMSTTSARRLVDELCDEESGIPVLVLHDFDQYGFTIAQTLTSVSFAAEENERVAYEFENEIRFIDLGLRLEDVRQWNLEPERVAFRGKFPPDSLATPEEQAFLRQNQRVELNAFTSPDFIRWLEGKLDQHGIRKVVPDDETLELAYRRAYQRADLTGRIEDLLAETAEAAEEAPVPDDLAERIRRKFESDPERSWDQVVADIAEDEVAE